MYCLSMDESNTLYHHCDPHHYYHAAVLIIIIVKTIIKIIEAMITKIIILIFTDELADMAIHSESDSVRDELSSGIRFDGGDGGGDGGDGGDDGGDAGGGEDGNEAADDDRHYHDTNEDVDQERGRGGGFARNPGQRSKAEPRPDRTRSRPDRRPAAADEEAEPGFDPGPALSLHHLLPLLHLHNLRGQTGPVFSQVAVCRDAFGHIRCSEIPHFLEGFTQESLVWRHNCGRIKNRCKTQVRLNSRAGARATSTTSQKVRDCQVAHNLMYLIYLIYLIFLHSARATGTATQGR